MFELVASLAVLVIAFFAVDRWEQGNSEQRELSFEKTRSLWSSVAAERGLVCEAEENSRGLVVTGELRGFSLRVFATLSDKRWSVNWQLDLPAEALPEGFEAYAGSAVPTSPRRAKYIDIVVGEATIDRTFAIYGEREDGVKRFMWREPVEEAFVALAELEPSEVTLKGGQLEMLQRRSFDEGMLPGPGLDALERFLEGLLEVVEQPNDEESGDARTEDPDGVSQQVSEAGRWEAPD